MKAMRQHKNHSQLQQRGCRRGLCCTCSCSRQSVSSSEEAAASEERLPSISSLAHAMVQERLDQMIRERRRQEARRNAERRLRIHEGGTTKFIVMVAMEKCSTDPKEDFRESMVEMIRANGIHETKELRTLLNYYISMNSDEHHGTILEVFHEVCFNLFLYCKCH